MTSKRSGDLAIYPVLLGLGAALALSGCASGGGSVAAPPTPTPAPTPAPTPSPTPTPPPTASNQEFQANWGLGAIHADAAYAAGGTGAGITVGVIDTGVNGNQADLVGAVSPLSSDAYATRNTPVGTDDHATFIAGVIAARYNGFGTIGVAYQSTILSVRADTPGSCTAVANSCGFDDDALATGINYAVAHGAKVINLSIGGPSPQSTAFQQALTAAVAAGVVFTVSAGNDGLASPDYPGQYAVDPRFVGSILAVGATDQTGALASFSNKAGNTASGYVVAPGDGVLTDCNKQGSCFSVSGTSFSAPHVAGALALILQAFPNLTGVQAVSLLERTADDLGTPGVDSTYGAGQINLLKAFAPVGTLSVPTTTGASVPASTGVGASVGAAFGDAVAATTAMTTVGYDSYNRLFRLNLAGAYRAASRAGQWRADAPSGRRTSVSIALSPSTHVDLTTSKAPVETPTRDGLFSPGFAGQTRADVDLTVTAGRLGFTAWSGQGGLPPAATLSAARNPFAAMAGADHAVRAGYRLGAVSIAGETGGAGDYARLGYSNLKGSRYNLASVSWARGSFGASVEIGELDEPQGPYGSFLPGRNGFGMAAKTRFAAVRADWALSDRLTVYGGGGAGRTSAPEGLLRLTGATGSTWNIGLSTRCARGERGCLRWNAGIEQPIRIESGLFSATLADAPARYGDPLIFSTRSFSATPSGRQINLSLGLSKSFGVVGDLDLRAINIIDDNNQAGAPMDLGILATWRAEFR